MHAEEIRARLASNVAFSALLRGTSDKVFVHAPDGRFVLTNDSTRERLGYTTEYLDASHFIDLVPDDEKTSARVEFEAVARGESRQYVATSLSADGTGVRVQISQTPLSDNGIVFAVLGIGRDLDVAERAERASRTARMIDSLSDGVVFFDYDWNCTFMNPRAEQLTGESASDLSAKTLWHSVHALKDRPIGIAQRTAMTDRISATASEFIPELGIWMEATAYPIPDGLAMLLRDVSEPEKRNRRLREQDVQLTSQEALLDNARDAIIVRGLDSSIRYWNESASRIYGWAREDVLGKRARDVLYSDPADFDRALALTMSDGQWTGMLRQVSRNGEKIFVDSSWTLVRDAHGAPASVFSINTDITEKRRIAELALRAERMESIGRVASGIAHDLNNVLTPILMAVGLLSLGEKTQQRRELLDSTGIAVKRGADMIQQVLSFATGATGRREPIDVASLLGEVSGIAGEWTNSVRLVLDVEPELWGTTGDDTQLMQVVLNLISNARDAMPDGGTVRLSAHNATLVEPYDSVSHLAAPGAYVVIEVADEGAGIPEESLHKIFEPFFTTKVIGHGTGLGLSTSSAIVRGHGGYMQAESEMGVGSTFRVHLPAQDIPEVAKPSRPITQDAPLPRGAGQLVLVVDDESAIRLLASATLEAYGYMVATAGNGVEAIDVIEAGPSRVDLVLTDMSMPVMDGKATAAYLLQHHPHIPVIASSGLNSNGRAVMSALPGVHSFLSKPYSTADLVYCVHRALRSEFDATEESVTLPSQ